MTPTFTVFSKVQVGQVVRIGVQAGEWY